VEDIFTSRQLAKTQKYQRNTEFGGPGGIILRSKSTFENPEVLFIISNSPPSVFSTLAI